MKAEDNFLFLPIILFGLLSACSAPVGAPEPKSFAVKMEKLASKMETPTVESFGSLAFAHKADLSALVEGTLTTPIPDEGQQITQNQLVGGLTNIQVQIQKDQALQEVTAAEAGLELAQAKLWQAKIQFETRRLTLEKTNGALAQKRLELEEAEKNLEGKEKLFELSGISEQDLDALKLKVSGDATDLKNLETDFKAEQIGLRDSDITAFGMTVPNNETDKDRTLETINTTVEQAEVDSAKASLDKAKGDVNAANLLSSELSILSPLSGILGARYIERGEHVTAGTKVATVFDDSVIDAVVPVREEEGLVLRQKMAAKVWVDALGGDSLPGSVDIVSPLVDPNSGHFTIKIRIGIRDRRLKPGLFARVSIPYGTPVPVMILPQAAIIEKHNEMARVFVVVNQRLLERHVVLGTEEETGWQVTKGLNEGDVVVLEPSPFLREGDRVILAK